MKNCIVIGLVLFILTACNNQDTSTVPSDSAQIAMPMNKVTQDAIAKDVSNGAVQSLTEMTEPKDSAVESKKYIALRHHLQIESPSQNLQANFDAAVKHCEALNCQVLSANYNRETAYNPPSASLSARIPPRNVSIFLSGLAKNGEVFQHSRESENKTIQVLDADARIKNLTDLRYRLRLLLNDKTAKLKDVVDVERELANTQSELDSMASVRKMLALETDLVAVNIDFTAAQGITEQGFFAPVSRALQDAGRVLMESIGQVITFIMGAIPWLLISFPIIWLMRKWWAKINIKRT